MCAAPAIPRPMEDTSPSAWEEETAYSAESRPKWERLVETWRGLFVPEGWRAEIIEKGIVMTPPPGNGHNLIASRVDRALARVIPDDWEIFQTAGLAIPERGNLFVPDLAVVPRHEVPDEEESIPISAEKALLAVEITSRTNADTDRKEKLRGYAAAGVPTYVLIDRFTEAGAWVSVYTNLNSGVYQDVHHTPFGEECTLPDPFELSIDTARF